MSPLTIGENDAADHLTFEPSCKTRCGWAKRTSSPIAGPGKVHAPVPPTINGPNRLICLVRSVPNAEPAPPSCCRMQLHLDEIATKVTLGAHAIILLDQAGWHGAKALVVPNNIS